MTFPDQKFPTAGAFTEAYFRHYGEAAASVDGDQMAEAARLMGEAYERRATIFACGNGGSAAISNHLHCDHMKGCQTDTDLKPRVVSLSATIETITAIANDISYDDVFLYQLRTMADAGDVLVTVSSSGDSENIVQACTWAKENGVHVISMTGFDGGRSAELADVNLHVKGDNYGVIEDVHQSLMHILAQYIRLERMDNSVITERNF
jgi:D-sedoheptulose 7-phosphate isomerase